ncbi:unnamed protein product [Mortierella alpina]
MAHTAVGGPEMAVIVRHSDFCLSLAFHTAFFTPRAFSSSVLLALFFFSLTTPHPLLTHHKHDTHHAAPMVYGEDPNIDTHWLLTWSAHALETLSDVCEEELTQRWSRFMALNQT